MSEESRRARFRSDFPSRDDKKWMATSILVKEKKKRRRMVLSKKKVKEINGPLRNLTKQAQDQPEHHLLE